MRDQLPKMKFFKKETICDALGGGKLGGVVKYHVFTGTWPRDVHSPSPNLDFFGTSNLVTSNQPSPTRIGISHKEPETYPLPSSFEHFWGDFRFNLIKSPSPPHTHLKMETSHAELNMTDILLCFRQAEDEGFFIPGREPPHGDRRGCRHVPVRRLPRRRYYRPHQHADRHDEPLLRGYPGTNPVSLTVTAKLFH